MHATSTSPKNDSHIKSGSLFEVSEEGDVVFVNRTQGHGVVKDSVGETHVIKESTQCVATAYKDHMMGGHGPFVFVWHGTGVAGGEEMNITETIGGNYGKVHSNFTFEITPTFHGKLLEKYVGAMSGLTPDMVADRVSNFLGPVLQATYSTCSSLVGKVQQRIAESMKRPEPQVVIARWAQREALATRFDLVPRVMEQRALGQSTPLIDYLMICLLLMVALVPTIECYMWEPHIKRKKNVERLKIDKDSQRPAQVGCLIGFNGARIMFNAGGAMRGTKLDIIWVRAETALHELVELLDDIWSAGRKKYENWGVKTTVHVTRAPHRFGTQLSITNECIYNLLGRYIYYK